MHKTYKDNKSECMQNYENAYQWLGQ